MLLFYLVATAICCNAITANDDPLLFGHQITDINDPIFKADGINYRLPNDTHPETYALTLRTRIDAGDFEYSGNVKIGVVIDQTTRKIVLHARRLTVNNVILTRQGQSIPVNLLPFTYDVVTEFLTISTNGVDLRAGERLLLEINFTAQLSNSYRGFYSVSYTNTKGIETWLAATHFEPTSARAAFPCYDEPALKAKFNISITHGKRYDAISNMPETKTDNSDDTATTVFEQTPLISTYLIAFVVSDFPHRNRPGAKQRVYAQPSLNESTELGLEDGVRILEALERYLSVSYALPKMDQVAVPKFLPGAMENWGLVLYREELLLWDPSIHPFTRQYDIVTTIAHEFGHQWFGNYVSPKYWQYLWLNEGFANLFQYIGTDLVYPDWRVFDLFVTDNLHRVLRNDASPTTRPMTFYPSTTESIVKLFDSVAYGKSGTVLRMFMHAFGEETFKKALNYYLTENAFKAASDADLFAAFEYATVEDNALHTTYVNATRIMSTWTNQAGYPLLVVTEFSNAEVFVAAYRYQGASTNYTEPAQWFVPVNFATSQQPNFTDTRAFLWLTPYLNHGMIGIPRESGEWFLLNNQQTALYRVLYPYSNYRALAAQLKSPAYDVIHTLNRAQLLDDAYEFVRTGARPIDILLNFMPYLWRETEYAPWKSIAPVLTWLHDLLATNTEYHRKYLRIGANLTQKFFDSSRNFTDWEEGPIIDKFARHLAINLACTFRSYDCLTMTQDYLSKSFDSDVMENLPPNAKEVIYTHGTRTLLKDELELLWQRLFNTNDETDARLISAGLGNIHDSNELEIFLYRTLQAYTDEPVYKSWRWDIFRFALNNGPSSLSTCMKFLHTSPTEVKKFFDLDLDMIMAIISEKHMSEELQRQFHKLMYELASRQLIKESLMQELDRNLMDTRIAYSKHAEGIHLYFNVLYDYDCSSANTLHFSALSFCIMSIVLIYSMVRQI